MHNENIKCFPVSLLLSEFAYQPLNKNVWPSTGVSFRRVALSETELRRDREDEATLVKRRKSKSTT